MAYKVVNYTTSLDSLVLTLLEFEAYPYVTTNSPLLTTIIQLSKEVLTSTLRTRKNNVTTFNNILP